MIVTCMSCDTEARRLLFQGGFESVRVCFVPSQLHFALLKRGADEATERTHTNQRL